jgi:hypothetical protein
MEITYSHEKNIIEITGIEYDHRCTVSIGKSGNLSAIYSTETLFMKGVSYWYATAVPLSSLGKVWVEVKNSDTNEIISIQEISTKRKPIHIAVVVCGQFRERYNFSESLNWVLGDLDPDDKVDVFITTWRDEFLPENIESIWGRYPLLKTLDIEGKGEDIRYLKSIGLGGIEDFLETYDNPDPAYLKFSKGDEYKKKHSTPIVFYKTKRGSDLVKEQEIKQGFSYDAIIRTRLDKQIMQRIDRNFLLGLNDGKIHLGQVGWGGKTFYPGGYFSSDWLSYSNGWCEDNYFICKSNEFHKLSEVCIDGLLDAMIKNKTWISHILVPYFVELCGYSIEENPYPGRLINQDGSFCYTIFNSDCRLPD